ISDAVKSKICETILDAVKFVDSQEIQSVASVNSTTTTPSNVYSEESVFNPAEFGASLCEVGSFRSFFCFMNTRLELGVERLQGSTDSPLITVDSNETSTPGTWSANLEVVYPPRFTNDEVVFGVDGGILFNGEAATNVDTPSLLNVSVLHDKMVGILLSDSIPNTLFSHLFINGMGNVYHRFEPHHLPKSVRKLANMFCSKCYLEISANVTEQPRVEISAKFGARVELAGNILIQFQGRDELHNLIYATTKLHLTVS
ncbi:hypothetical protein NECAME_04769, partial [Necator americanus]